MSMVIHPILTCRNKSNRCASVQQIGAVLSYQKQGFVEEIVINLVNYTRSTIVVKYFIQLLPFVYRKRYTFGISVDRDGSKTGPNP